MATVSSVDLTELQAALRAGEWRRADEETGRLLLVDGDEGGFAGLEPHEIEGLDCARLQAHEQAWAGASQGRFGFSAQLEIVDSVLADGVVRTAAWQVFGTRTGWVTDDGWATDRSLLVYDIEAPRGHLPWFPATFPTVATGRTFEVLSWFYDHARGCLAGRPES